MGSLGKQQTVEVDLFVLATCNSRWCNYGRDASRGASPVIHRISSRPACCRTVSRLVVFSSPVSAGIM